MVGEPASAVDFSLYFTATPALTGGALDRLVNSLVPAIDSGPARLRNFDGLIPI